MVLLAAYLSIDGNDLSKHTKKAEVSIEVEEKDVTTFRSQGWKELLGGLKSGELSADFIQDFAPLELDAIMWPMLGRVVPFEVRADEGPAGPSNPAYTGNVLIKGWQPITGSVGDEATASQSWPTSGAVTRAVA
ncbi:phage tail tube protein [Streptomyces carpaticus]|uniref:phage tail tube protein n=1 Tax=Streptomyces carpaticus TaxID=285558 RepID=UPI0031F774A7